MKKVIFILVFFMVICAVQAGEQTYSLTLDAGIRYVNGVNDENGNNLFEEVYGKNNLVYSIDFGYNFLKYFQVFLHGAYFSVKGELTFTGEETTMTLIPMEFGFRFKYMLGREMFYPYIGVGGGYYMFKEENVLGTVEQNKAGFFGETGFNFYFVKSVFLDLKAKYVFLKVDGAEEKVDLGGLALMGGLGFSF